MSSFFLCFSIVIPKRAKERNTRRKDKRWRIRAYFGRDSDTLPMEVLWRSSFFPYFSFTASNRAEKSIIRYLKGKERKIVDYYWQGVDGSPINVKWLWLLLLFFLLPLHAAPRRHHKHYEERKL